ncbi:SWIRM domain-containing protein, partial [Mycotypha africana]|uniref:SWIRM domain-containing protein n=1 Tax=Mycotypha africana TaxID=64632 RepID=UPI002300BA4B
QQYEIIIPSYAAWFDLSSIHPIEKRGLPEFFNNKNKSKIPTVYKEIRDFMVNTYRLNPMEYLTVTACRRNMTGDVCAIIRVHAFLEQWGLINYQMDPAAKPTIIGPPFEGQLKVVAELPAALHKPVSVDDSIDDGKENVYNPPQLTKSFAASPTDNKITTPRTVDTAAKIYEEKKQMGKCESCQCQISLRESYQFKNTERFVCSSCYGSKKLISHTAEEDYKKKGLEEKERKFVEKKNWTEQEEMLLLEGLEMFTDWEKVAQHVATKTKDECVLHFLKLPLVDPRVDSKIRELGLLDFNKKDDVENPIMSVVAFLAANVNPKVAVSSLNDDEHNNEKMTATIAEKKVTDEEMKEKNEVDLLETKYHLIKTKMEQFKSRISQYEEIESFLADQRRQLERER